VVKSVEILRSTTFIVILALSLTSSMTLVKLLILYSLFWKMQRIIVATSERQDKGQAE
jgi:hypothetical protein